MPDRLLVRGGTLIDRDGERRGDVLIEGERIAATGPGLEATGAAVVDAGGALVIPGAIDVHTHLDLPVGTVRSCDDFESGTVAAACGGTTCVIDFAGAGREPWAEALATWHQKASGRAVVDYGFHLTVTSMPESFAAAVERFAGFAARGVTSVKLYMAYPDRLMVDDASLGRALAASVPTGVRVMVHAEDGAEIERRRTEAVAAGHSGAPLNAEIKPPSVEAAAIARAAALAAEAGAELYVVHLSSQEGLGAILAARARGARVRAETCPQYLYLDQAWLLDPESGPDLVCSPPIRHQADRDALWAALGSGAIEVVATDHCPFTRADRRSQAEIPGGLPGVETRLSLVYQAVRDGRLTPERWVDLVAGAPARLFGLETRKGSLRAGMDADLVLFDPEAGRRLDAAALHSRSDHSPYQGMDVVGWPALTISRGVVVARDGKPADVPPGRGRFVERGRSTA